MSIKLKDTIYDLIDKAIKDNDGYTIKDTYLKLSGGTLSANKRLLIEFIDTNTSTEQRGAYVTFRGSGKTDQLAIGFNTTLGAFFEYHKPNNNSFYSLYITPDGELKYQNKKIWYEDNDGSGSGLNADLLDGKHASEFSLSHTHPYAPTNHSHDYLPLSGGTITRSDRKHLLLKNTEGGQSTLWLGGDFETFNSGGFLSYVSENGSISLANFKAYNNSSTKISALRITSDNKVQVGDVNFRDGQYFDILHSGNWSNYCSPIHGHPYLSTSGGTLSKDGRDVLALKDTSSSTDGRGAYMLFQSGGTNNRVAMGLNTTYGGFFEYYTTSDNKYHSLNIKNNGVLTYDNNVVLHAGNWSSYISAGGGNYVPNNTGSTITGHGSYLIIGQTGGWSSGTSAARKLRLGLGTVGHTGSQYWTFCVDDTTSNSYLQIGYDTSSTAMSIRHDGLVDVSSFAIGGQVITFTT